MANLILMPQLFRDVGRDPAEFSTSEFHFGQCGLRPKRADHELSSAPASAASGDSSLSPVEITTADVVLPKTARSGLSGFFSSAFSLSSTRHPTPSATPSASTSSSSSHPAPLLTPAEAASPSAANQALSSPNSSFSAVDRPPSSPPPSSPYTTPRPSPKRNRLLTRLIHPLKPPAPSSSSDSFPMSKLASTSTTTLLSKDIVSAGRNSAGQGAKENAAPGAQGGYSAGRQRRSLEKAKEKVEMVGAKAKEKVGVLAGSIGRRAKSARGGGGGPLRC
ncbi:hypothetical protein JCM8097_004490 [Rhodosporidiobolus ruineniae]